MATLYMTSSISLYFQSLQSSPSMPFRPEEFRGAIADNTSKYLLNFLKQLIYSLKHQKQSVFLVRVISELAAILKDQSESPILKLKSTKFIIYLIILGEMEVYESLKQQIFPILRNACLYNRRQPFPTRGIDFFKNNKYTSVATFDEKGKIKNIGCKYILFCLECVYVLSQWIPSEPSDKNIKSIFRATYQNLLKEGVQFPTQEEFNFFNEERIRSTEAEIKQCQQEVEKMSSVMEEDYFESVRSKNDAQMMNGVQYLQRRLKQKDKIISDMKSNHSINGVNRQSAIDTYIKKVENYEQKIADLTEQVKNMKALLRQNDPHQLKKSQSIIKQLHAQIDKLSLQNQMLALQNQQLKQQIERLNQQARQRSQQKIGSVVSGSIQKSKSSNKLLSPRQKQYHYLKQLMQIQVQPNQFVPRVTKNKLGSQQFLQYKQAKQCFIPFIDSYTREQTIRLKKSILKSKQVLFKNRQLQVGLITLLRNSIQIFLTLIVTNISQRPICLTQITYQHTNDIEMEGIGAIKRKKIKPGQQLKQQAKATVNNIDSRCVVVILQYQQQQLNAQKIALILPICKFKLVKILSFTSHPKDWIHLQRIFQFQKKVLSNLEKLKEHFGKCFLQAGPVQKTYNIKCELLQKTFFVSFNHVGQQSLRIIVHFNSENRCLAQKLLNQFLFILSK